METTGHVGVETKTLSLINMLFFEHAQPPHFYTAALEQLKEGAPGIFQRSDTVEVGSEVRRILTLECFLN